MWTTSTIFLQQVVLSLLLYSRKAYLARYPERRSKRSASKVQIEAQRQAWQPSSQMAQTALVLSELNQKLPAVCTLEGPVIFRARKKFSHRD